MIDNDQRWQQMVSVDRSHDCRVEKGILLSQSLRFLHALQFSYPSQFSSPKEDICVREKKVTGNIFLENDVAPLPL